MKKKSFTFAILAMAVATIVSVAIVSCKKESTNELLTSGSQAVEAFTPPQIDDMVTYLKDFKQKMHSATKGDDEALSLDEAAWHLACLANVDFCKVNVEYNDFLFDTVEMQVNVTDGTIAMSDLNTAYEQMCDEIQQFKKGFNHCDQNMYFVNMTINSNGKAKIALMTSFNNISKDLYNHTWYFDDEWDASYACEEFFSPDSIYDWRESAVSKLRYALNSFEHHTNNIGESSEDYSVSYIPTRNHTFDYTNTHDPYDMQYAYYNSSRVFAKNHFVPSLNYDLEFMEMCYCLDSYLGLGYDYITDNQYINEHPVSWNIYSTTMKYASSFYRSYHQLFVEYGRLLTFNPIPDD